MTNSDFSPAELAALETLAGVLSAAHEPPQEVGKVMSACRRVRGGAYAAIERILGRYETKTDAAASE